MVLSVSPFESANWLRARRGPGDLVGRRAPRGTGRLEVARMTARSERADAEANFRIMGAGEIGGREERLFDAFGLTRLGEGPE